MVPFSLGVIAAVIIDRVRGNSPSNKVIVDMLLFGALFTVVWEMIRTVEDWEMLASL